MEYAFMSARLKLGQVPRNWRKDAREAYEKGDAGLLVGNVSSQDRLLFVADNVIPLQANEIYEACLLTAFVATRMSNWEWPEKALDFLFRSADRAKLRAAGKSLPGEGPFRIYRGVAGTGPARRRHGYSWTDSLDAACWFANRSGLPDPEVLTAEVQEGEVLAYVDDRGEREFVTKPARFMRYEIAVGEMSERAARWTEQSRREEKERLIEAARARGLRFA
jgi:hypothetical protein